MLPLCVLLGVEKTYFESMDFHMILPRITLNYLIGL